MKAILLIWVATVSMASCGKNKPVETPPVPEDTIRLKSTATFPIGCAVNPTLLAGVLSYRNVVTKEFNAVTPENEAKLGIVHPQENQWNYAPMDAIMNVAIANNIRVHGHVLVWHVFEETDWVKNFPGDSAAWENMLKTHIQTLVTKYKGKIKSWDVVNEAFNDDGSLRLVNTAPAGQFPNGSIWVRKLGNDYIARAFQYAHQADPDALLFYNDYDLETKPAKLAAVISMVNDFKARGIPIHGVGTQSHMPLNANNNSITNSLTQLAATGLKVHISELDILVSNFVNTPSLQYTEALQTQQADKYKFVAQTYKASVPPAQRWGITTWGVGDADSWIPSFFNLKDWPLLFDRQYKRKKAYYSFREGLKD
jgi:endo-1,4-beta-xylanase